MSEKATSFGSSFRAHVKTHKTTEGTRMQLQSGGPNASKAVVVSTMPELWHLLPLIEDGSINDVRPPGACPPPRGHVRR